MGRLKDALGDVREVIRLVPRSHKVRRRRDRASSSATHTRAFTRAFYAEVDCSKKLRCLTRRNACSRKV